MTANETPLSPSFGIAPGDEIAGKYRVERIVGRGGMGVVVSAVHVHLEERVAIKLLLPGADVKPEVAERFMREARAAVKIKSQHVAKVMDVGIQPDGRPYMVMEFLEGRDLGEELDRNGPLPEAVAVEYVLQACDALAEAHRRGIVHRDLKPSNLFLCKNRNPPIIKLLDFGVSKMKANTSLPQGSPSLTAEAMLLGTPYYMSPEQIRSAKDVDERADVWALGVILYELISGKVPFDGTTATEVLAGICGDKPKPLIEVCPSVSPEVSEIVGACLEKTADTRMPNVRELVRALATVAPQMASNIEDRISAIDFSRNTSDSATTHRISPRTDQQSNSRATAPTMASDEMLGASVGGVAQTSDQPRNRAKVVFVAIASVLFGVGLVFAFAAGRGSSNSARDMPARSAANAAPAIDSVMAASPVPATTIAPVTSASPITVEPAATIAATAPVAAVKANPTQKASSAPTTRSTSTSPIQLGKEVETRR